MRNLQGLSCEDGVILSDHFCEGGGRISNHGLVESHKDKVTLRCTKCKWLNGSFHRCLEGLTLCFVQFSDQCILLRSGNEDLQRKPCGVTCAISLWQAYHLVCCHTNEACCSDVRCSCKVCDVCIVELVVFNSMQDKLNINQLHLV